jgi:hypothetical protein
MFRYGVKPISDVKPIDITAALVTDRWYGTVYLRPLGAKGCPILFDSHSK